jgi:acetyl-CoA C-acetyltransferase
MAQEEVVVIDAKRTPIGKFQGKFAAVPAPMLAAKLLKNLTDNAAWVNKIDEVILGNVLSAGIGQAPARQAVLKAGLSEHIPAATINKMCGSGLYAVSLAYQAILAKQRQTHVLHTSN